MNVLVVGGSGFVGTNLTAELTGRGHAVTVLSRSPAEDDLPADVATTAGNGHRPPSDVPTVTFRSGDVTDYDSIESAFEGHDAVVNLVALSPLFKPPRGKTHEEIHLGGTENVVKAAEAHGVPKLIQMSALGADPDGTTGYIRSKGKAETVVRDSALDWVIVRPSVIFGEGGEFVTFTRKLTTPYVSGLPGGGKSRFQPIWIGDMVRILADCVEDDEHVGETDEIGGPEVLTLANVAKLAERAKGRSLTVLPIPMPLAAIGLALADPLPFVPMGSDQYRSLKFDNTVRENDIAAFGIEAGDLRTLADYLGIESTEEGTETAERGVTA